MDKPGKSKAGKKNKSKAPAKPAKQSGKKRKCETGADGPTCTTFLSELTKKWAARRRQEEEAPINVVQAIIDKITKALPIRFYQRELSKRPSPVVLETLQTYAPELVPNDSLVVNTTLNVIKHHGPKDTPQDEDLFQNVLLNNISAVISEEKPPKGVPRMPVADSAIFKGPVEKKRKTVTEDIAVNTGADTDVATEIAKHVSTLKKISLIAEEFNQKTAKNLKEIVDSVQDDLMKKLSEIKDEQKRAIAAAAEQHKISTIEPEILKT